MKKILFLSILFHSSFLFGQIKNIRNYQENINNAELSLIAGNKSIALNEYYTTLIKSEGNFCKDIYNATELTKKDTFFVFLNLLTTKGLTNSYINGLTEFSQFHKDPKWIAFLKDNQNYNGINKELKAQIDSLHDIDQFFRTKDGSYKVYGDTIKQIDRKNMLFMYSLITANEFPGEHDIGVNSVSGDQGYDILFHHYTQSTSVNKRLVKITPLLVNLVLQGKILPNKCSDWLEMQDGEFKAGVFGIKSFKINGKQTGYFRPAYDFIQKLIIDEYRKWLCLETLEDYYKKFTFVISNPDSKYKFDIRRNIYEVDENMYNILSKNMIEIK